MTSLISVGDSGKETVGLLLCRQDSFRQRAAIVVRHAVFPLEKVGNGLRLNANLDPAQAGKQQIHLVTKSGGGAHFCGRVDNLFYLAVAEFEQSPSLGEIFGA